MDLSVESYMVSLGIELWPGESFYVTDPESRFKAAEWYREFTRGYQNWRMNQEMKSSASSLQWADLPG